jgi:hypothetical protein
VVGASIVVKLDENLLPIGLDMQSFLLTYMLLMKICYAGLARFLLRLLLFLLLLRDEFL